jgi:hypothetical protein
MPPPTDIGFFGHAVADTNQDLKSLIGAAPAFQGPGFLLPTRNHEVFAWCLDSELKLVMQMTLMTIGLAALDSVVRMKQRMAGAGCTAA